MEATPNARARRCFCAFIGSLSTLVTYGINPWWGWGWVVFLGFLYIYTEVVR